MAKYSGTVGYVTSKETAPDIFEPEELEIPVRGDVLHLTKRYTGSDKVNEDITLNHRLSIVGSEYAFKNFMYIKWATYMGSKWRVQSVEVMRPRLILNLGGLYNG